MAKSNKPVAISTHVNRTTKVARGEPEGTARMHHTVTPECNAE